MPLFAAAGNPFSSCWFRRRGRGASLREQWRKTAPHSIFIGGYVLVTQCVQNTKDAMYPVLGSGAPVDLRHVRGPLSLPQKQA
jgi:hypothetical protein